MAAVSISGQKLARHVRVHSTPLRGPRLRQTRDLVLSVLLQIVVSFRRNIRRAAHYYTEQLQAGLGVSLGNTLSQWETHRFFVREIRIKGGIPVRYLAIRHSRCEVRL